MYIQAIEISKYVRTIFQYMLHDDALRSLFVSVYVSCNVQTVSNAFLSSLAAFQSSAPRLESQADDIREAVQSARQAD